MADIDPRILQFDALSKDVLASTQRAARTVTATEKKAREADESVGRLQARAESRGAGNLATEAEAGEAAQSSSRKRAAAYDEEAAALRNLSKVRSQAITQLEAEQQIASAAYKNVRQYGPYAGGRKNFEQFGYGGGKGGVPSIPPGGVVPPEGGFLQLPEKTGPKPATKIQESPFAQQEAQRYREASVSADRYSTSVSKLAVEQNLSSQAMRKNGALTTEFIAAANRGEVTIRELGYQTAATIGKFGGWLAAGSAVYGVFSAVQKLGAGALDAYSGVNELQRVINNVNPTTAKQQFAQLAGEFNVPIQTVTESVYQMGKVFHSQDQAIAASRAVLYSYKVGELDVADSSRYLIAILNGFHLPASKVAQVFDQINEAQNQFGITIQDVEAGLAKASGTFHAAGGSYSNLLALITTAQKATGNTGSVIGTALARAPNFLRKPENEQVLKEFGIKPGQAIDKVIEQAFNVAQGLSGKRLQILASAIFGPQFGARIGTPLLQQQALYEKVKKQTSPEAAHGSAQRELHTQLGSVNEEISKIGVSLERVGGSLAGSHAFDALGGLLKLLNVTLGEAVQLSEAFDALPDGVKRTLSYVGELAIAIRVLRRFNLGETLGQGKPGVRGAAASVFSSGPIGEARKQRQALIAEKEQLEGRIASQTGRATEAGRTAATTKQVLDAENQRAALLAKEAEQNQAMVPAYEQATAAVAQYQASLEAASATQRDLATLNIADQQRLREVEGSLKSGSGRFGLLDTQKTLADREAKLGTNYYAPGFDRPSADQPVTGPGLTEDQAKKLGTSVGQNYADLSATQRALLTPATESLAQKAESDAAIAKVRVSRVSQAAGAISDGVNSVINKLGTIFFVGGILFTGYQLIESAVDSLDSELKKVESLKAGKLRQLAKSSAKSHGGAATTASDFLTGSGDFHGPIEELFGYGSSEGEGEVLTHIEEQKIAQAKLILKLQRRQKSKGEPQYYRTSQELQAEIKRIKSAPESQKKKVEELERVEAENEHDFGAEYYGRQGTKSQKAVTQAIELAKALGGTVKNFAAALKKLSGKELGEYQADYESLATTATGKFDASGAERLALVYRERARKLSATSGPKAAKELLEAEKGYFETLSSAIEGELTVNLERSRSPQDRIQAEKRALDEARTQFKTHSNQAQQSRQQLRQAEEHLAKLEQDAKESANGLNAPTVQEKANHELPGGGVTDKTVQAAKKRLEAQKARVKDLAKSAKEQQEAGEILEEKLRQQIYEFNSALRDARYGVKIAGTQNPLKQAQLEIEKVNADLPGAIRAFGHESQQVYALLEQRENAINNIVQQELSLIGARDTLGAAGINPNDNIAKSRAALKKLEDELSFEQTHANHFNPSQIIELEAQIREAQVQLAVDIETEATELRDAAFQRKTARLEADSNPIGAAKEKLRQLKFDIAHAKTPVEKANLEAQLPTEYRNVRETAAKTELENIEYKANIDKLTTTQEIAALERLIKDYKLSKDMRRQIREQIHSLKSDEGFELDVGSITLPTVYDIRRAIKGGTTQNSARVQVNNAPRITVNNYSADDKVVGRALGRVLGGSTASAARSAGVA